VQFTDSIPGPADVGVVDGGVPVTGAAFTGVSLDLISKSGDLGVLLLPGACTEVALTDLSLDSVP